MLSQIEIAFLLTSVNEAKYLAYNGVLPFYCLGVKNGLSLQI